MNNYFYKIYLTVLTFLSIQVSIGQSNSYFSNGEVWAGESWSAGSYNSFYIKQLGDTVLNNDTLVKLSKAYDTYLNSIDTSYYLAKNDSGILHLYYSQSNFSSISDSVIIDYSRTDSITFWASQFNSYEAREIIWMDTVYFNGKSKKLFRILDDCGGSDDDFILEGAFNMNDRPFFDGCFEYWENMICFSINDTSYFVSGFGTFSETGQSSGCVIDNLIVDEYADMQVNVFPNPVLNQLNIESNDFSKETRVTLFSINGMQMIHAVMENSSLQLDLSELSSGIYFLHIENIGVHKRIKITKL
jgi:Secretion system C-terminal sorting domain